MQVTQIKVSDQLVFLLDGEAEVTIETTAALTGGSDVAAVPLEPERQDIAPALALFGAAVVSSHAFKTGRLCLTFSTGSTLLVDPHPQFEAWNVRGPAGLLLVCQPGGEVAIWS